MENKSGKMKSFDLTLMAVGAIIGAGVFSMTGVAVGVAGPGVPITFLIAGLVALLVCVPHMVVSSAIPAKGGRYLYVSRFLAPVLGFMLILNLILEVINISVLGLAAGQYLPTIIPGLSPKMAGAIMVIVICVACLFNIQISAKVQNIMVIMVLIALGLFVILGIPHIKHFSFTGMFTVTGFSGIIMGVSYVRSAAYGAVGVVNMAGEVENPEKAVPSSMLRATIGVSVLYAVVGLVAVGVVPWKEMIQQPLAYAAKTFMPSWIFGFFVVGGAVFAILTTLVAMFVDYSRAIWAAADDGIFPAWLKKTNRYGIPYRIIILMGIIGLIPILLDLPLTFVFAMMNAPGMLVGLLETVPVLIAPKKLPKKFDNAWFKLPRGVVWFCVLTNFVLTCFFSYTLFTTLNLPTILGIVAFYGGGILYYYARIKYLKKTKGIDLEKEMSEYEESWVEK